MDPFAAVVTQEQFNTFHSIDRDVYAILTIALSRDPIHSMQIMAFWIWLEHLCLCDVVYSILSLPWALVNELAEEAALCLASINNDVFVPSSDGIPLTVAVVDKDYITLAYFFKHRVEAREKIGKEYNRVCVRALSDIMHQVLERNARHAAAAAVGPAMPMHHVASTNSAAGVQHIIASFANATLQPTQREEEEGAEKRTMFATFSKGYPVGGRELREFLIKNFGADCIESLHMQEVAPPKQALYARIVFRYAATMDSILKGMDKAKFNINGKHVWVRKFVPYTRPPHPTSSTT